jgi:hypothetical protein
MDLDVLADDEFHSRQTNTVVWKIVGGDARRLNALVRRLGRERDIDVRIACGGDRLARVKRAVDDEGGPYPVAGARSGRSPRPLLFVWLETTADLGRAVAQASMRAPPAATSHRGRQRPN